jgi:hypothetical protein
MNRLLWQHEDNLNLVDLNALAGDGNTVWPYWQRLDYADNIGPWCLVSDPEHQERKEKWRDQYLPGMTIRFGDIVGMAAPTLTLLTPDLTIARIFAKAGGNAVWCDKADFHPVAADDREWLASVAAEGFDRAT